jgi:hypothetical protein
MARGQSIHIGLNSVDPDAYGGWAGELNACEFDADDMRAIAEDAGFTSTTLLTQDGTSQAVLEALRRSAAELESGDTLLLTYSGHGGQIPDTNSDEADVQDETWVLFDRQVLDDELYAAYSNFAAGVRIAVFSDSCHSGTVTRVGPPVASGTSGTATPIFQPAAVGARSRAMPAALAQRDFLRRKSLYEGIQHAGPSEDADFKAAEAQASILLISGCQDNQLSLDGTHNGLFTATLLTVWNGGQFRGGYPRLRNQITARMPQTQTPKLTITGTPDRSFIRDRPFTF